MYIFRGRGVFIDVYKADDKLATSGATSLADIDLRRTYRAMDSGALCDNTLSMQDVTKKHSTQLTVPLISSAFPNNGYGLGPGIPAFLKTSKFLVRYLQMIH